MKALLTGITGNLGYELSLDLIKRGIAVIPCVRPGNSSALAFHPSKFREIVECDLTGDADIEFSGNVDCIVHCAGIVHFRDAGNKNERMMRKVLKLAGALRVPVYFASTAFAYSPPGKNAVFNNAYEEDKFNAEQLLTAAKIPHAIFRPSVLTGHSRTGKIRNFSGFYLIVQAFIAAVRASRRQNHVLRFPKMTGQSNMVPVDQAAAGMGEAIEDSRLEVLFVTNPTPPKSEWVLDETLKFFTIRDCVNVMDISLQEYGKLDLTEEEAALHRFSAHFSPYWSMDYTFPPSLCTRNLINHDYLTRALTFFSESEYFAHGQTAY